MKGNILSLYILHIRRGAADGNLAGAAAEWQAHESMKQLFDWANAEGYLQPGSLPAKHWGDNAGWEMAEALHAVLVERCCSSTEGKLCRNQL
jgi:hypothetical protein